MKLFKVISSSGELSRRKSIDAIQEAMVTVNGKLILDPFTDVEAKDDIRLVFPVPAYPFNKKILLFPNVHTKSEISLINSSCWGVGVNSKFFLIFSFNIWILFIR